MTGLSRSACLIGLAAGMVLSTSGCDPYTYFNVNVSLGTNVGAQDRMDIASCLVFVVDSSTNKKIEDGTNLKTLAGPLACRAGEKDPSIGTMDYSTARSGGTLKFIVSMQDTDPKTIVQGSVDGPVKTGQVLSLDLVASPCNDTAQLATLNQSPKTGEPDCIAIK